ncbi:uncharacterized protein LOC130757411 [Actinidia eriantha]|uniref:uncharacterized protein LOC130757411 n=1 Tax=Actinidia eriantha TaxID=165200 RepID=UPI00258B1AAB|nr:uncharacterized protein LOC130757411 [Actinidia eriantha]
MKSSTNNHQFLPTPTTVDHPMRSNQSFLSTLFMTGGDGTCTGTGMPVSGMSRRCSGCQGLVLFRLPLGLCAEEGPIPPESALGLLDKDQIEQMSATVVIVTLIQFGYKFIMGLKEFVNNPRTFLNDILNRAKHERDMRECIIKIRKDLEKIQEHLGIDQDGGVDEDGEGNAGVNPSDGLKGNGNAGGGGIAVPKAGSDDVEEGSSVANPRAGVEEGSSAANPSAPSAGVKENGSSAANPRAGVKDEEGGVGGGAAAAAAAAMMMTDCCFNLFFCSTE